MPRKLSLGNPGQHCTSSQSHQAGFGATSIPLLVAGLPCLPWPASKDAPPPRDGSYLEARLCEISGWRRTPPGKTWPPQSPHYSKLSHTLPLIHGARKLGSHPLTVTRLMIYGYDYDSFLSLSFFFFSKTSDLTQKILSRGAMGCKNAIAGGKCH